MQTADLNVRDQLAMLLCHAKGKEIIVSGEINTGEKFSGTLHKIGHNGDYIRIADGDDNEAEINTSIITEFKHNSGMSGELTAA